MNSYEATNLFGDLQWESLLDPRLFEISQDALMGSELWNISTSLLDEEDLALIETPLTVSPQQLNGSMTPTESPRLLMPSSSSADSPKLFVDHPPPTQLKSTKKKPSSKHQECMNCFVTETPLWRRTPDRQHSLCNACGLYLKQYGKHRPLDKSKTIRSKSLELTDDSPIERPKSKVKIETKQVSSSSPYAQSSPRKEYKYSASEKWNLVQELIKSDALDHFAHMALTSVKEEKEHIPLVQKSPPAVSQNDSEVFRKIVSEWNQEDRKAWLSVLDSRINVLRELIDQNE